MDPNEAREKIEAGESYTVRFKTPREGQTVVEDMIRGPITFENANLEDFVLMKSTDTPTYNFAAAFDDAEMEISHVIRGDDHLSNTPRQILIHEALGNRAPCLRPCPPGPRARQEEARQAPRRGERRGLRGAGLPARGALQLPRAPRRRLRRGRGDLHPGGTGRALPHRPCERQPGDPRREEAKVRERRVSETQEP